MAHWIAVSITLALVAALFLLMALFAWSVFAPVVRVALGKPPKPGREHPIGQDSAGL